MSRLDQTIAVLEALIAYPTVSRDSNLGLIAEMSSRLSDVGADVQLSTSPCGTKANLFATIGPMRSGGIVLSGHSDVVPAEEEGWLSDPFKLRVEHGLLYGRGSCDMKGFIAAVIAMAPEFAACPLSRPLHIALTYDEEVGCLGARHLVAEMKKHEITPRLAIIGEPTEMRIIEGHKGCCEYTTRFRGLEGHGSAPHLGVSAVEYAVRYVSHLLSLRPELVSRAPAGSRFDPPETTLQIGRIAGGVAHNVVAGLAEVDWELRPVQDIDRHFVHESVTRYVREDLLPAMRAVYPDAGIETDIIGEVVGLEPMATNEARELVSSLTGSNEADCVAFGTEAGLFQGLGMDVVVCGPGSIRQAHKANEYLAVSELSRCIGMLEGLCDRLGAEAPQPSSDH